jgi:pyruvate/2-oxoglutarate dehydrogenase complex dihydrolipoamide acyltransferase (E2) component
MPVDVTVPSVGESITEVFVGAWLKQPGDAVKRDDPLVELETDKATVEVPSPVDGVLAEQLFAVGDTALVGDVIARVERCGRWRRGRVRAGAAEAPPAAEATGGRTRVRARGRPSAPPATPRSCPPPSARWTRPA